MRPCAIIAEGPDDLAALRVLLRGEGGKVTGVIAGVSPLQVAIHDSTVSVYPARGKKKELAQRTLDAAEGTAGLRPEVILVCFDPDSDTRDTEFAFFKRDFDEVRGTRAGPLKEDGSFEMADRVVRVEAAPWRLDGAAAFGGLPDHHNLERVLLTGVLRAMAGDPLVAWADQATGALVRLVTDHGWKRAARLWSAALRPHEAFVDALLQENRVKDHCLQALRETRGWAIARTVIAP